jgi:cellulose 1,4-beta-cellobiosidase
VNKNNFIEFTITTNQHGQTYQLTSDVMLNPIFISNSNPASGTVLRFNSSNFVAQEGNGQVTLSYNTSLPNGVSSVDVYQSTTSSTSGYTDTGQNLSSGSSVIISGLINGTTYWFEITISTTNYVVIANPAVPSTPTNLTGTPGSHAASFTFSASTGATSVSLYQSSSSQYSGFTSTGVALNASSTSASVTGLTTGKQYWFKLVITGGQYAGDSNVVSVTPT